MQRTRAFMRKTWKPALGGIALGVVACHPNLAHAANAVKDCACIPRSAHIAYAQIILTLRADGGDERAARKLREYEQAATDYEGARVALADLTIDG